jgi:hypothetical protein
MTKINSTSWKVLKEEGVDFSGILVKVLRNDEEHYKGRKLLC